MLQLWQTGPHGSGLLRQERRQRTASLRRGAGSDGTRAMEERSYKGNGASGLGRRIQRLFLNAVIATTERKRRWRIIRRQFKFIEIRDLQRRRNHWVQGQQR